MKYQNTFEVIITEEDNKTKSYTEIKEIEAYKFDAYEPKLYWQISSQSDLYHLTRDENLGDENNPESYGKKKYKYVVSDDYLYLNGDYKNELSGEDYEITSVGINIRVYDYGIYNNNKSIGYHDVENNETLNKTMPCALYGRKQSTGEWEKLATFDYYKHSGPSANESFFQKFKSLVEGIAWEKNILMKIGLNESAYGIKIFNIPSGYTSTKIEIGTNDARIHVLMAVNGKLKRSERINKIIEESKTDKYPLDLTIRNDATLSVYDEDNNLVAIKGTSKRNENNSRTLDLDLENYGYEMYHDSAYYNIKIDEILKPTIRAYVYKKIGEATNDRKQKEFKIPVKIEQEYYSNNATEDYLYNNYNVEKQGAFYDLLPLGINAVSNIALNGYGGSYSSYDRMNYSNLIDKDNLDTELEFNYKLFLNWRNSGRTMLVVQPKNLALSQKHIKDNYRDLRIRLTLAYTMHYSWESYEDYGNKIERNLVGYELKSVNYNLLDKNNGGYYNPKDWNEVKNYEIPYYENIGDEGSKFVYAQDSTSVSGNTIAVTGLHKNVKGPKDYKYVVDTETKERGNYSYRLRFASENGTTTRDLILYDSIENYDPIKSNESYGRKQWKGTLQSIDTSQAILKGADPKVYVSTVDNLNIKLNRDLTNTNIWKPYTYGDDLSNVHAVAVDLTKRPDGSKFELTELQSISVLLHMKAPQCTKDNLDALALNQVFANNTPIKGDAIVKNDLIDQANTIVRITPLETEATIKATKKHLDKEGNEIALKGNDFTFELKDDKGNTLQTKTNDSKGDITFDPIKYNSWDVGEHTYKIVEVKGDSETTAYDDHEETVTVKVERVGDSDLKADIAYSTENALFTNHEVDSITTSLEAKKVYIGKGGVEEKPKKDAFEFILKDLKGKEIARAKNDADGKVTFNDIAFKPSETGEHKYTIEEIKGADPSIDYDTSKKNVTITVSLGADFKLKADVVHENNETPTFTNTLKAASLQLVKVKNGVEAFPLDEVKENEFLVGYKVPQDKIDLTLNGAEYELYKINEDNTQTLVTTLVTENGISKVVNDLTSGDYILKETKAPQGYLFGEDIKFSITDKEAGTIIAKFATDKGLVDMPSTGGRGTKALMIGGGTLLIVMACLFILARKKKDKQKIK